MSKYKIPKLPLKTELETKEILKQVIKSSRKLAELKGIAKTIPNQAILINNLSLQESKDSSAIENIITTYDELFTAKLNQEKQISIATKEVKNYQDALIENSNLISESKILTINNIITIQKTLEENNAGIRKQAGTTLKNQATGEEIYKPPQDYNEILKLMKNLEDFINNDELSNLDNLIKMAIIHHQFESIHPFYDGNGRTGRIINVLYLVIKDLLDIPILYLSKYIVNNKNEYYHLLQDVRDNNNWNDWILYILKAVEQTATQTIGKIKNIKNIMAGYKEEIREKLPNIYSQDLLNSLFIHTYTVSNDLEKELNITRKTAMKYLNELERIHLLIKTTKGRRNYFINAALYALFTKE
jgi:Fic family protein